MTLTRLYWADTTGQDVHLLPGLTSPEFNALLLADDRDPVSGAVTSKPLAERPDVSVRFSVQINGTLASHGLEMLNDRTGAITVLSTVPEATKGHSFLVIATATQGTVQATTRIRVYVHDALHSLWLTPFHLTVRFRATGVRLSVLARFTDGLIGDITNWSPPPTFKLGDRTYVHAKDSTDPVLSWRAGSDPSPIEVHRVTGVLEPRGVDGVGDIIVEGRGLLGLATASSAPPWSTPVDVTLISGPGFNDMNLIPNLLFLPDGFAQNERGEFEKQVRRVVTRLSSRNRTRPFGVQNFPINFKMNYFMAWVPSNDAGVSVLNELDRVGQGPNGTEIARGLELASPQRPDTATAEWTLPQIINEVGLPTELGTFVTRPLGVRVQAWHDLYGPQVTRTKVERLDAAWLDRRDRILVNEVDTAFHLAFGERPAADAHQVEQGLAFNPRRLDTGDFDAFLDALREPPSRGFPRGRDLPKVWSTGKDRGLIVIVARSLFTGGQSSGFRRNVGTTIGVSLAPGIAHRVMRNGADLGWDLAPVAFRREPHHHVWMTAAHELGHSCGLGEEYADIPDPPTLAHLEHAARMPNNQVRDTLLDVAGQLRADNIRWRRWPRIAKAAALLSDPRPLAPGRFSLSLEGKPRPGFARGDVVRLRTRPLALSTTSGRFLVDSVAPQGFQLEIVALPGTAADPAGLPRQFPAKSIVMAPVRARDPEPAANRFGDDLGMVTDEVIARIDLTHNPLNARPMAFESDPPNDPANRPCPGVVLPVPTSATNFRSGASRQKPLFSAWIIGLYENAARHRCGIYRPTGVCIMGTQAKTIGKESFLSEFCQVCRYAIVDALFPTAHADVEIDYHSRYGR
jgi:hypothetical protein